MPSTGRSSAIARAQRLVEPLLPQLGHRRAGRADARQHREVGARDVVDELGAEAAQRDLDRADVPGAVVADGDLHSRPFVDGMPDDSCAQRGLAARGRPPCTRPRRCGARRGRSPRRAPRAARPARASRRSARPCRARARSTAPRAGGRRGRRRRARARRPSARPRRRSARSRGGRRAPVERLAERERGVLDRVVVAGLEIARALDDEVEPGVEGELLEEVVVDPGAGLDPHAARAVEAEAHRDPRLGGRAQVAHAAARGLGSPARAGRARARASRRAGRRPRGRGS